METFTDVLNTLDGYLGAAVYFPFLLLGVGLFFTLYLGFPQIRYFRHAWRVLTGRFDREGATGDTSHFQALSTALSGTVGTGNIGGVAFAIYLGGPAALFWMWATAVVGMTTKFVEVTLSYKYRVTDEEGHIAGGPMYYMERGLNMKWLAVFFAIATVISSFGTGNLPQSNNIAIGINTTFGIPAAVTGGILAVLLGLVIVGGIKRIARVASSLVPLMGAAYAFGALAVLLSNTETVIPALVSVFSDAFTGSAAAGGFLGASFAYAFNRGVNRGLFSNEAGQGSAPIAHAAARGDEPVSEGLVSILEPFIDTIIICTLTGVVILSSGVWKEKFDNTFQRFDMEFISGTYSDDNPQHVRLLHEHLNWSLDDDPVQAYDGMLSVRDGVSVGAGEFTVLHNRSVAEEIRFFDSDGPFTGRIEIRDGDLLNPEIEIRGRSLLHSVALTTEAFKRSFLGEGGKYVVSLGLLLFAFSTAIAWSYYGDRAMTYLFGVKAVMPYRVVYVGGFFAAAIADTSLVWLISAISLALMAIPNLIGIMLLRREMKSVVGDYLARFHREFPEVRAPRK